MKKKVLHVEKEGSFAKEVAYFSVLMEEMRDQIQLIAEGQIQLRTELKTEIQQVRTELESEIKLTQQAVKFLAEGQQQLRTELKAEIQQFRDELKTDIKCVRVELAQVEQKLSADMIRVEGKLDNAIKKNIQYDEDILYLKKAVGKS